MAIKLVPIKARVPNISVFQRAIKVGLQEEGREIEKLFDEFFKTWDGKPIVRSEVRFEQDYAYVDVRLKGDSGILQIAEWVIRGTDGPYPIAPRGPWPLRYPGIFTPKTQPGVIQSQGGGKSGPIVERWGAVEHPGIKARNIDETIAKARRPRFRLRMARNTLRGLAQAIARGVRR